MSQTKKTGISVTKKPFTPAEIRALNKIIAAPTNTHNDLKRAFAEANNRRKQDVHNYVYKRVNGITSMDASSRRRGGKKTDEVPTRESTVSFKNKITKKYQSPDSPRELKIAFTITNIEWKNGKMIITAQSN